MLRKLMGAIAAAALFAALVPASPAEAQQAAVVVFTAGANVCHDAAGNNNGACDPGEEADFWAPVAPQANCDPDNNNVVPGVVCDGANEHGDVLYTFSTNNDGIGGERFCVGVGVSGDTAAADESCELSSTGNVFPGVGGLGAWCGYSAGSGEASGTLTDIDGNDQSLDVDVEWAQSAGTVLPLLFTSGGLPAGVGAVQTTGATPGTCGLNPQDGNQPTNAFAVTGFAAVAIP